MSKFFIVFAIIFLSSLREITAKSNLHNVVIDDISDIKEMKKLFRTKTNVLVLFVSSIKETQATIKNFREAAETVKGLGTMVLIDCSNNEKKKICKKMKVSPSSEAPHVLKHYKDGDYHRDYDRKMITSSLVNFMRDPTGDLPWEEDPLGSDVYHILDANTLGKILKKESRPIMIMFYAPWCGFCKQLKPDYSAAATELKPKYILAAIDVDRPENSMVRRQYNITGFPTLLYYEHGKFKFTYEGENKKAALVAFMQNPTAPPLIKPKEDDWSAETTSEIVHLTTTGFEPALKDEKSVLVMFYAPWCGHCKRMKPEYEKAAEIMKNEKIPGILAALDATKESSIGQKYGVKGYPTVKYFVNGEFKFDVSVREADKIVTFMKDPKEPPPPPPPEKPWDEEETEVVHLNDDNFKTFLKKKKHALVMFYAPWCGHCKKAKPEFTEAANHFKDDPRVALAGVDCTRYSSVCSGYEVRGYPTIKYFSYLKTKFDYNGGRTSKDFIEFLINPSEANSNKKSSEPEPFGAFPGAEKILILGDKDLDTSLKSTKKALVMFYAPWCGHCKNMKPEFAAAAGQLDASHPDVKLAAVDCDTSPISAEKHKIQSFPTLKYFENGEFIKNYSGPRTAKEFVAFVSKSHQKDEL